jgi:hypothetical protein
MTLRMFVITVGVCVSGLVQAQPHANFSGTWALNVDKSRNLGMMASMQDTVSIEQTAAALTVHDRAVFQGRESTRETRIDLSGKPSTNAGPMGEPNETVAQWRGSTLVVTWTADGAVAGSKVVRTETRALSADGKTMTVESTRGATAPIVMVYDKR